MTALPNNALTRKSAGNLGLTVMFLGLLTACVSDTLTIPNVEERRVEVPDAPVLLPAGSALEREHKKLVNSFGGEYRSPRAQIALNEIANRLQLVSDRPNESYRVIILNSSSVNAFALPNGYVYLTRGLLALCNDTAEIASVIAHEIAHVIGRHAMERAELESKSNLVSRVMSEVLDNPGASQIMRDQSRVTLAGFSRQQEMDADEIGVKALARAGFEAFGAARFLVALDRSGAMRAAVDSEDAKADMLATHPTTPERLEKVIGVARQFGGPGLGEANRTLWQQAINGMAYGEDPAQGVVRERMFLHPRLAFAFEAPEGFVLENTPDAVLGVTRGAKQALRFDSARTDPTRPLAAILVAGPIEGIPIVDIKEGSIAGLPSASGIARGSDWSFRVTVIRSGEIVYRFIFAAQGNESETEQRFQASAGSFRALSADEKAAIRIQRIGIVMARADETIEAFVKSRMGRVHQGLERFMILNGLSKDEHILSGQSYKIITEG